MRNGIIAVAVAAAIIVGIAVASRRQEPASPSKALQNAATQAEQTSGSLWNQAQDLVPQASKSINETAQQIQQTVQSSAQAVQQQAEQVKPKIEQAANGLTSAISEAATQTKLTVGATQTEQTAGFTQTEPTTGATTEQAPQASGSSTQSSGQ